MSRLTLVTSIEYLKDPQLIEKVIAMNTICLSIR